MYLRLSRASFSALVLCVSITPCQLSPSCLLSVDRQYSLGKCRSDGQHQRLSRCPVSCGSFKACCVPDMGLGAVSEECVAVLLTNTRAHGRKAVVPLEYDSCI